ncbi:MULTISPECIES: STAS/SEC14 domain-containing protein [unclassified Leeuwenhoekiella]|uniref:STAS/SEC14 domain-containing protein n=1 Tax=unclassified Leeuwenhoekiella TaxID=2615029 RepID=UPI000C4FA820|nr:MULTISPECIES: STAS/SEC14 domain-containing protein [unclassified Leeuwenhoekiella]MAW97217.1 hypothetical protein [Leeuwenhoekiella sp.]MBA82697.1 hypothetical protein [Leeuwenhoekiella sp.]|tara:strand:- start:4285 stop:4641 length:357 start_codon:yes stop_codon:yes gene_type:complete
MGLKYFELGNQVVGFVATSKIDEQMLDEVHLEVEKRLEHYDKIRVYCENASGLAMSLKVTLEDLLFKIKYKDRFEKIAIVSDIYSDKLRSKAECTFVKSQCHFFKCNNRTEALQWVSS